MATANRQRLADLVSRAQGGDRVSREELMVECARLASRIIGACTGFAEDEEDILQAVLVDVYLNLGKLRDPSSFGGWLARIAQRRTRDFLRRRYSEESFRADEIGFNLENLPSQESTDRFLAPLLQDQTEALLKEIQALPLKYQRVLTLVLTEGNSLTDIASRMELPENTVKTRYHRGVKRLRSRLESRQ